MPTPTDRLLATTRRRLFAVTFGLVALLVIGIGVTTAVAGFRALDADVDRALRASVDAALERLEGTLPSGQDSGETEESPPAAADTFLLYLNKGGALASNPSGVNLRGLPDTAALAVAARDGSDLRTIQAGGTAVRLLTRPIVGSAGGAPVGYVQGGFVLTLHDRQSASLAAAIALVAVVGLIGAALVTLLVTGRAVVPIRRTFEAQQRFVADASHELRTPAALIRANAEVLDREGLVTADGQPLIEDIVGEADRLARLVADMLGLGASDATELTLERRPVDLAGVARDTVRGATALASERGVSVAFEAPRRPDSTLVSGDRGRLVQLILILLDNALDHSPAGGVVAVQVERQGDSVELSVQDEGPGIPPEERERVFEPFHRLSGVRRDRSGGTGLGLTIGRRIALAHHGSIDVEEAPGGGARFTVRLPATRATAG